MTITKFSNKNDWHWIWNDIVYQGISLDEVGLIMMDIHDTGYYNAEFCVVDMDKFMRAKLSR